MIGINRIKINRPKILPKKARCVFHGALFDTYQWKQKMFDRSFQIFEMLKRPDTVVIVPITDKNKIIVLKQKQPHRNTFLSFPSGRVDDPANIDLEALRELKEESGYQPKHMKLWMSHQVSHKIDSIAYFFIAQACYKVSEPTPDLDGEKITVLQVSFEEFLKLAMKKYFRKKFMAEDIIHAYYNKTHRERFKNLLFGSK